MTKRQSKEDRPYTPTLTHLPLDSIRVGEQQLRSSEEDETLVELAMDIAANGLLQPIGVKPIDGLTYQLLYGSRRLAAHRHLKRDTILAQIHDPLEDTKAAAIRENVHRLQLTLSEEVNAVTHLHDTEQRSPDQVASLLGKSRGWVLRRLAVPQLPPDLRAPLIDGRLSLGAAEELARITDTGTRSWAIDQAAAGRLSIADIRAVRETAAATPETAAAVESAVNAGLAVGPPPTIYLDCAACGAKQQPQDLRIVRICADGCAEHKDAQH